MSGNTLSGTKHAVTAIAVFTAITLALLSMTGTFSSRSAEAAGTKTEAAGHERTDDAGSHGEAAQTAKHPQEKAAQTQDACCPKEAPTNLSLKEIEQQNCECGIRQVACDECRYELGVVKVDPSVTRSLTRTAKVEQAPAATKLQLTGEVQFDRAGVVDVLPIAPGKVIAVRARLGQQVQAGDVLAVIRSSEFGEAKAAYLESLAAAEIATREQQRQAVVSAALERLLAVLAENPALPQGPGKEPLGEWRSKLVGAAARLQQARTVAGREKALVDKQASSQAEYETAQRELQTAQADYAAMVEEVQLNLSLDGLKAQNAARQADARLSAAEQRLHLCGLNDEAIQMVSQRKENGRFADMEILAPRAGTITAQNITEGAKVETTQNLCTIADMANLWVWCNLYERDLGALHTFMAGGGTLRALVRVPAFDETFDGVVDLVGHTVDETTRTIKVRVQVKNEGGKLKPGMFAGVTVELPGDGQVSLVPRSAVLSDEGQTFAFQHWKDDLWLRRNVVLGKVQEDKVQVLAGLDADATVVVSGAFLLKSDVLRAKMGAGCAD
jgi:membrane fusion protein, heavy metal efflux system